MLDEFEAEYAQWLVDHPYIDDVEDAVAQMRKDGEDVDCSWLLDSVIAAGAELAEKWKAYCNK